MSEEQNPQNKLSRSIATFLETDISKEELATALKVLRAFKECESTSEWLAIPFAAWTKLEQFEEYLGFLVEKHPLEADTLAICALHNIKVPNV